MPFPSTNVLYDFTADENPLSSTYWNIATGYVNVKALSGYGTPASTPAPGACALWKTQYPANQEIGLILATPPAAGGFLSMLFRSNSVTDYLQPGNVNYEVAWNVVDGLTDYVSLYRTSGGAATEIGTLITINSLVAGDSLGARISGSTIEIWRNNVLLDSRTDATITGAGYIGLYFSDVVTRVDKFRGGDIDEAGMVAAGRMVMGCP